MIRSVALLAVVAVVLGGCRFKGWESFESATGPNEKPTWGGDPYASGGVADSSGGTKPDVPYAKGANATSAQRTDPFMNRPAKGTGQMPGETPGSGKMGHGPTNTPVFQGSPSLDQGGRF